MWTQYCSDEDVDPFALTLMQVINYLADLVAKGRAFGTINNHRSVILDMVDG